MTEEQHKRYAKALHSMQSAVAFEVAKTLPDLTSSEDSSFAGPKHLRTGLNAVMADHGALAALLAKKGVFTEEEYFQAIVEGAEREAAITAQRVRERFGLPETVSFG